ncbi:hypothetical protein EV426DRAFT_709770 [Tirmania nivea]|nr:hypothetical protein EV426DRAFT_709770 [Tirmania nivea]
MTSAKSWICLEIRKPLTACILLLQVLSLVSVVQCYQGDVSRGRLPPHLVHVPAVVAREKNPFSLPTFPRRRKRRDTGIGEGITLMEDGSTSVTATGCKEKGLVMCGDKCVEKCCNAEKGFSCPANSSCEKNGLLDYCCEKGKSCSEPVDCLNLHDSNCENNPGQVIKDRKDGKVKLCCYVGHELCANASKCIPSGVPQTSRTQASSIASDTVTHVHSSSIMPQTAQITHSSVGTRSMQAPAITSPAYNATGTEQDSNLDDPRSSASLIGGLIGGAIGLIIMCICVSFTAKHYRQRLMEEKEADANLWEDDDSAVMGIRRGNGSGRSSSSGSSSSGSSSSGPSSTVSWRRWVEDCGPSSPKMSSSWSKSTLSCIPSPPEKNTEISVMELEHMPSSKGRSYTRESGMGPRMSILNLPPGTAGVPKPFDWRSCQALHPRLASGALQRQEGPSDWKSCLPWLPLELNLMPASPILGPWSESRRSMASLDHRMSQRLSFRLDMPPTPRLQGKIPTRMGGALRSSNGYKHLRPISIQKPPNALLAPSMPMI